MKELIENFELGLISSYEFCIQIYEQSIPFTNQKEGNQIMKAMNIALHDLAIEMLQGVKEYDLMERIEEFNKENEPVIVEQN